jgi:hypothetical protein
MKKAIFSLLSFVGKTSAKSLFVLTTVAFVAVNPAVAHSSNAESKITRAIETTQLLTAAICGKLGNLDPQKIKEESNAFVFILALSEKSNPEILQTNAQALVGQTKKLRCGSTGILQLTKQP